MKTIELLSGYGMKLFTILFFSLSFGIGNQAQAAGLAGSEGVETAKAKVVNVVNDMLSNSTWWVDFLNTVTPADSNTDEPAAESEILSNPTFWKDQVDEFVAQDSIFEEMNTNTFYWSDYIKTHPAE